MAAMVAKAWPMVDDPDEGGFPLSPRLFVIKGEGDVALHDVGLPASRVANWTEHLLDGLSLRTPSDWFKATEGDDVVLASPDEAARIRIHWSPSPPITAFEALQFAEDYAERAGIPESIQTGFFHGLPWAWVNDPDGVGTVFVGTARGLATFEIQVPPGVSGNLLMTVRKIIATLHESSG